MIDMRKTVIPKSDQLNADDLIGQNKTIKVTKVSLLAEADQPISIGFEGDNGKPYKPCKSMRRVMVNIWGPDGNAYIGRSMTIYRDDKVIFGGAAVGGIRISHMSHIEGPVTMALTVTRANRKPFTVQPLAMPTFIATHGAQIAGDLRAEGDAAAARGVIALRAFWTGLGKGDKALVGGAAQLAAWKATAESADAPDIDFDDGSAEDPDQSRPAPSEAPEPAGGVPPGTAEATPQGPLKGAAASPPGAAAPSQGFHEPAGPSHGPTEARPQGNTAPRGAAVAGAGVNAPTVTAAPSGRQSMSGDAEADRRARKAEIRKDGDARAAAGTAPLADFLEGLRKAGEADLVSSTLKAAWHDEAKAADAKGRK